MPFTIGTFPRIEPASFRIACKSNRLGAWLYCTTTVALGADNFFKSGEIFESSADATLTATKIQITRNFLIACSPSERGARRKGFQGSEQSRYRHLAFRFGKCLKRRVLD